MSAQRNGSLLALGALSAVATLSFGRLLGGTSWVLPVLLAVAGAHGMGLVARRWPAPLALLASGGALLLLAANVTAGETTLYGVPTGETLDAMSRAWAAGFETFRHAVAPTPVTPGLLLLSVVGTWVCATTADWLAFRAEATLSAVIPPFVLYVVAAALGTEGLQVVTTFVFVVAALVFVTMHQVAGLPTAWFAGRTPPPGAARLAIGGAPIALFVAAAGLVLGPTLPGARAEAWLELRGKGGGGDSSRITVSPLVDMKPRLTSRPVAELFTVASPVPLYWRLTALENYDGRIWSSRGTYRRAEGRLDDPDEIPGDLVYSVNQEFRIGDLESFWLPAAYRPARIDLDGARVNAESLTLLTEEDSAAGLVYTVKSDIPRYAAADLQDAPEGFPPALERFTDLPADFPADVRGLARNITAKAEGPYQKALALQSYLRENYEYDEEAPAGHSDDHLRYFLFRSKIGYCEQFSGAFAAMARSLGLPSRVAVGFTPGEYDDSLGLYRVTTKEAHAWPEVFLDGLGWVAFEPTPGRYEPNPTNYTGTFNPDEAGAATTTTTAPSSATEPTAPEQKDPTLPDSGDEDALNEDEVGGDGSPWLLWVGASLAIAALIVSIPPAIKRRRRARRRRAADAGTRVSGAWSEALDRLREAGAVPAAALTPLEFAGQAVRGSPAMVAPLARLARLFTKVSYSPQGASDDEAKAAWEAVDTLTEVLDSGDTRLRRWRRRLNPRTAFGRG